MNKITLYPADIYQVVDKSLISEMDKLILNMLYMPVIGNNAVSLYLKLQSETRNIIVSPELTHHHLMTSMAISLENLKQARLKLEGIGLMKTYFHKGEINSYVYELYTPVSAKEFFSHPVFNVILYNNVGKNEYNRLVDYFKFPDVQLRDYEEITLSFDQAYKTSNYTDLELNTGEVLSKNKLKLKYDLDYDFDLLVRSLPSELFNEKCLNKSTKELIVDLSFLYDIDPIGMADIIRASLNEKGNIVKEELRKNTRNFYQFNNDNRLPSLIFKNQPEYLKSADGDNTKRGKIIKVFESFSPYEFLKAKNKGTKPSDRDMQLLETLLIDMQLKPAVVNVLIDYVLKTNNNKLTKAFVETIAGQWKRNGIETASEAMDLARKENSKKCKVNPKKKECVTPGWLNTNITSETNDIEEDSELNNILEEFRK